MYAARPRYPQRRPIGYNPRPVGYGPQVSPNNIDWKFRWPSVITMIIAVAIIIVSLAIFGLEIASLVKGTGSEYKTAATGSGIWCGFFIFVAGVLIIIISMETFFI